MKMSHDTIVKAFAENMKSLHEKFVRTEKVFGDESIKNC